LQSGGSLPRKKKTKIQPKEPAIKELSGFKLGDFVFGKDHINKIYDGEVVHFYPDNKEGPCLMIITRESGYRVFLTSKCSFDKKDLSKK